MLDSRLRGRMLEIQVSVESSILVKNRLGEDYINGKTHVLIVLRFWIKMWCYIHYYSLTLSSLMELYSFWTLSMA